jgi:hypothetical protein
VGNRVLGVTFHWPAVAAILVAVLGTLPTGSRAIRVSAACLGDMSCGARCFNNVLWEGLCRGEDILFLNLARRVTTAYLLLVEARARRLAKWHTRKCVLN